MSMPSHQSRFEKRKEKEVPNDEGQPNTSPTVTTAQSHSPVSEPPSTTNGTITNPPPHSAPDFIQRAIDSLEDSDPSILRPDGDINFERDFGQWLNSPGNVSPTDSPEPSTSEFMRAVQDSLATDDPSFLRPDEDIRFQRDFGRWYTRPQDKEDEGGGQGQGRSPDST